MASELWVGIWKVFRCCLDGGLISGWCLDSGLISGMFLDGV